MWSNPWKANSPWPNGAPPVERTELPSPPPAVPGPGEEALPAIEGTPEQQRDALLRVMKTNRSVYDKSPSMQRKLLQLNAHIADGTPLPVAAPDPVAAEIGQIENVLFTDRAAYDKDGAMQERYRELLSQREANR